MSKSLYLLIKLKRELLFLIGLLVGVRRHARVVIVTRSRSGSNMLCSLLESHPHTFVWREVFRRPQYFTPKITEWLISRRYLKRYRVVAFKVFYYHRVPGGFWERLIADEHTYIIHLVRLNFLETYVSRQQALTSGRWEDFGRRRSKESVDLAVHVDVADLLAFLEQNEKLIDSFAEMTRGRKNLLTLTFEEVATGQGKDLVAALLADHLNPSGYGRVRNIKQGRSRLEERISNFPEVRQAIENSRWRHLLVSARP